MTDTVDRALRDFVRYTGDGVLPAVVGAPLPIGDPASGVHNPKKSDMRAAMNYVVEAAEAVLVQIDLGALDAARLATAADVVLTHADVVLTDAARVLTETARDAAIAGAIIPWPTTAAGVGQGIAGVASIVGGSGGTNGTFALAFSGGTQVIPPVGVFTVAGGALVSVIITYPGHYSAGTPTLSFAASAGLVGASATAVMAANTPVNGFFAVPSVVSGEAAIIYKNVAGVATEVVRTPSSAAVGSAKIFGSASPIVATGTTNTNCGYISGIPLSEDSKSITMTIGMGSATTLTVFACTMAGLVPTFTYSTQVDVVAGINIISFELPTGQAIPAGQYMGFTGTGVKFQSGPTVASYWRQSTLVTSGVTAMIAATTPRFEVQFQSVSGVSGSAAALEASTLRMQADIQDMAVAAGSVQTVGFAAPIVGTGTTNTACAVIFGTPLSEDSKSVTFTIGMGSAQTITLFSCTMAGLVTTFTNTMTTAVVAGINTVTFELPAGEFIPAGQYMGFTGAGIKFVTQTSPSYWRQAFAITSGATMISATSPRFEIQAVAVSGVSGALQALEASVANVGGLPLTGLVQLLSADSTGVSDCTAAFAAARVAHPHPYLPPGNYSTTGNPVTLAGIWGPGIPYLNGDAFFLPPAPARTNLYNGLRAALQEHITNGDVLTVIGDSITHWAYAADGPNHWLSKFTRFANAGIAADEPTLCNLRDLGTYTPAFYGVTFGGAVTAGTNGPIGVSAILAAGASMTFSGAYEEVDVFYTQQSGAGSLQFQFNAAAAFKTLSAAGSLALDAYSGPTVTGQAGSGTYTITASGGAVEITGLIRLGVKAANSKARLRVARVAMGGYTFASFTTARVVSLLQQATYSGGVCVPILALGINDAGSTPIATIVANALAVITQLKTAGVDRIYAIPIYPASLVYGGGLNFDAASGALRRLYRSEGVTVLPIDHRDWFAEGFTTDGVHPGPAMSDDFASVVIQGLIAS